MVFSGSCVVGAQASGVALVVPFAKAINDFADLVAEATCLWRVESNAAMMRRGVVSGKWGSVGLLMNPERELKTSIVDGWKRLVTESPDYGTLRHEQDEPAILNPVSGLARFPWPCLVESGEPLHLDALMLTATNPSLADGRYPGPEKIADAWNDKPHRTEYFRENRKWGITTAEDEEIESFLLPPR